MAKTKTTALPETLFASLAHEARLRCLVLLHQEDELCVCELTHALDQAQPIISRHLAQLREAGWVEDHRKGQWVYYRLHGDLPVWARKALAAAASGIGDKPPYSTDRSRLRRMTRPATRCA